MNKQVIINSKPKFDLGDKVIMKQLDNAEVVGTVVKIEIAVYIDSSGMRRESVHYNVRYPVREMSNDSGFAYRASESKLSKYK